MSDIEEFSLIDRYELISFLQQNSLKLSKKLGQNFLVDPDVLKKIIVAAELDQNDYVIEIGAGIGTLTRELAARSKGVTALEFDQQIFPALEKNLENFKNIELKNLDVRKFQPPKGKYKLVANIPYYLTSPILRQFFVETQNRPQLTVLLIQKEVAEKIVNPKKLSVLALQVKMFGNPEIVCKVPKNSFLPPPKVESAVLKVSLKNSPEVAADEVADFFKIVHAGFRAPRKKIYGSLAAGLPVRKEITKEILKKSEIDLDKRPEDLSIQDWQKILRVEKDFDCLNFDYE